MAPTERDLVVALRAELAAIDPARACDRAAERLGLGRRRTPRDGSVARLAIRLDHADRVAGRRRAAADPERRSSDPGPAQASDRFDWPGSPDHCRMAYLRGRFLACGSLSLASARSHLEFVVAPDEAATLAAWLADAGLPASARIRRGRGVVTWKSTETIGTFLRRIGAGASLLELEARQVGRALRGELNRVLNAESANLQRVVAAAGRQLAAIDQLEADGLLAIQPYTVRLVAEARRETPEAALGELAERLGLHRSAVQRALERIEWLVLHEPGRARGQASRRTGAGLPAGSAAAGRGLA